MNYNIVSLDKARSDPSLIVLEPNQLMPDAVNTNPLHRDVLNKQ